MACYSTQNALLEFIESWKKSLENNGFGGVILLD